MAAETTVLVTGATDGIGRETALELARRGARVVVHGRDPVRIARAVEEIRRIRPDAVGEPIGADFASLAEVRAMAVGLAARPDPVHVLVNNAGVYMNQRRLTADGIETTMAVNHFAHFLLTHLLLSRSGSALRRILNVSSVAHHSGRVDPDDAVFARGRFDGYAAYAASKLANVLFTLELARRLPTPVTVNALHPGVVSTKLLQAGFGMPGPDSLADGAATPAFLALSPDVEGVTGRYFVRRREAAPSPGARDPRLCALFYEASASVVGVPPLPVR